MIKIKNCISLIGMSGCGKSSLGKSVSKRLKMNYIDIDREIEKGEKKTITEIFKKGEKHFRDIERQYIKRLYSQNTNTIFSTGGGAVLHEENRDIIKKKSLVIFIDRKPKKIMTKLKTSKRPLLKENAAKSLNQMYKDRIKIYESLKDIEVDNNRYFKYAEKDMIRKIKRYLNGGKFENRN